jgi:hypothetical protein
MKKYFLLSIIGVASLQVQAQGLEDLVRFSSRGLHGSPRFVAVGGAFGALGNDFSGIQVNPAGAAVFRRSEAGIAFNFQDINTQNSYFGQNTNANDFDISVPQFGFVSKLNTKSKTPLSFAITMNRTADFNGRRIVNPNNAAGSILDFWADAGTGIAPADLPLESGLAYDAFLINPDGNGYNYSANTGGVNVYHQTTTTGRANELGLTFASVHKNKLHFGATLNIASFRYLENSVYTETFRPGGDVRDLRWEKLLDQTGTGISLRAGVIYKLNQMVRLGLSATTPTFYQINDFYRTDVFGTTGSNGTVRPTGIASEIFYGARTPADVTASAAFIIGKNGFISADYRFVDFGNTSFGRTSFDGDLSDVNQLAKNNLGPVQNLRIGGELRLNQFFLRSGYNLTTGPFTQNTRDGLMQIVTGGLGYRGKDFEFNMALAYANTNRVYQPFPAITPQNIAGSETLTNTSLIFGFGYRF